MEFTESAEYFTGPEGIYYLESIDEYAILSHREFAIIPHPTKSFRSLTTYTYRIQVGGTTHKGMAVNNDLKPIFIGELDGEHLPQEAPDLPVIEADDKEENSIAGAQEFNPVEKQSI